MHSITIATSIKPLRDLFPSPSPRLLQKIGRRVVRLRRRSAVKDAEVVFDGEVEGRSRWFKQIRGLIFRGPGKHGLSSHYGKIVCIRRVIIRVDKSDARDNQAAHPEKKSDEGSAAGIACRRTKREEIEPYQISTCDASHAYYLEAFTHLSN
jgi:hypothetical protein